MALFSKVKTLFTDTGGGKNKEYSGLIPMIAIAWMMAWESNQIGIHIMARLLCAAAELE